jgi:hypothetical protein
MDLLSCGCSLVQGTAYRIKLEGLSKIRKRKDIRLSGQESSRVYPKYEERNFRPRSAVFSSGVSDWQWVVLFKYCVLFLHYYRCVIVF